MTVKQKRRKISSRKHAECKILYNTFLRNSQPIHSCYPHICFTGSPRSLNLSVPKRCRYLKALLSSAGECEEESRERKKKKERNWGRIFRSGEPETQAKESMW
ncbi:hypothetical protein NPIL_549351 [Nephila pilipes]|uniref:Uncharacterized protein n=1 Tax=Nephila pilipes TaxID=299642 RepID=A0A8X6U852_NEPPI|nr:hypothetical protein NPIL_549351 [Nephila pilipes]